MERQDANAIAYNSPVTARLLLGGAIDPPEWASTLTQTLQACTGMPGNRKWIEEGTADGNYVFGGLASPGTELSPSYLKKKRKEHKPSFPPAEWGSSKDSGSYFTSTDEIPQTRSRSKTWDPQAEATSPFETRFESDFNPEPQPSRHPRFSQSVSYSRSNSNDLSNSTNASGSSTQPNRLHTKSMSMASPRYSDVTSPSPNPFSSSPSRYGVKSDDYDDDMYGPTLGNSLRDTHSPPFITPKPELVKPLQPHEGVARAIALYDFRAVEVNPENMLLRVTSEAKLLNDQSGDLSFSKGDVITILQKSDSNDDWYVKLPVIPLVA